MPKNISKEIYKEICNECGQSVLLGSGRFVNRIPDGNDFKTRIEMGKPYPKGNFICAECDNEINKMLDNQ